MNDVNRALLDEPTEYKGGVHYQFSGNRAEAAQLIADDLLQLRKIAQQADMGFLAYLLEMSFREAFMTSVNSQFEVTEPEIPAARRA